MLAVIDEIRGKKNGEREDSHIVVLLLVRGTKAFCVQDQHLNRVTVRREAVNRLAPNPYSLLKFKGRVSTNIHTDEYSPDSDKNGRKMTA